MPATQTAASARTALVSDFLAAVTADGIISAPKDERALLSRLCELGFAVECSRCCGSGSYGPTTVEGGRCFKCGGAGKTAPSLTKKLLATVREQVTPAVLSALVAERVRKAAAKKFAKGAEKRVSDAYITTLFVRHFYGEDGKNYNGPNRPAHSPLAYAIHDGETAPREALSSAVWAMQRGERVTADEVLALEAAVVRARKVQDLAFAFALASGAIDRSAAWSERLSKANRFDSHDCPPEIQGREYVELLQQLHQANYKIAQDLLAAASDALAMLGE